MKNAIELKHITKRFPSVVANRDISFSVERGTIHAIAGENGAGKSTLMNILFGLLQPDEGEIWINGELKRFESPKDSIASRIGMVHQHFMLIPKMTVLENIIVGDEPGTALNVNRQQAAQRIVEISDMYQLNIDPWQKVSDLSVPEQQRVEIAKVLYRDAEILIFDEPTAVLPPQLIDSICEILLGLKRLGKTIIFITHKLAEVFSIADHVTVLRLGEVVGSVPIDQINREQLTHMMVGRSIDLGRKERDEHPVGPNVLEISDLRYTNHDKKVKLDGLDLSIGKGEIFGIAGVDGNGQEELCKCLLGILEPDSGSITLNGTDLVGTSIRARKDLGIGYIAEDRQKESLILQSPVFENMILGQHHHADFSKRRFWLRHREIQNHAEKMRKQFDIRCAHVGVAIKTLSGGNQQKAVIAREAHNNPEILVAIQPTRGLDIGASEAVQKTLMEIRNQGKAVMLISMELDEILAVSDRVGVIFDGKIIKVLNGAETRREELGRYMLGDSAEEGAYDHE